MTKQQIRYTGCLVIAILLFAWLGGVAYAATDTDTSAGTDTAQPAATQEVPPAMPDGQRPDGMQMGEPPTGEPPAGDPGQMNGQNGQPPELPADAEAGSTQDTMMQNQGQTQRGDQTGRIPGNGQTADAGADVPGGSFLSQYGTAITSLVLLAAGFVFVIFYKRKNY